MRVGVEQIDALDALHDEQLGAVDVVRQQRCVGGAARQLDLVAGGIDHVTIVVVVGKNAAHVTDVVGEAGNDQVRVVGGRHVGVQRAAAQDVVAGQRHQHGVLDVVVERVAVADAFERDARDRGHHLDQPRLRRAEPALHIGGEELAECIGRQFRYRDHGG